MLNGKPIAIDLFCGAGGLSEGLKIAGFKVILAADICDSSAQTYMYNHSNTFFIRTNLSEKIRFKHLLKKRHENGDIDLVAGGPPCQGFSNANRKTNESGNPLNRLVYSFIDAVKEIKPESFLMENVPGFLALEDGEFANEVVSRLEEVGYAVNVFSLNAADFGVPQMRERIFFAGCSSGKIAPPKRRTKEHVSVRDAIIGDLPPINRNEKWHAYEYLSKPLSAYQKYVRGYSKKVFIVTPTICEQ